VVVVVGGTVDVLVVAVATVVVRTGVVLGAAEGTVVGAVVVGAPDGVLPPHAVSTPLMSNTPAPRTIGKASRRPAIGSQHQAPAPGTRWCDVTDHTRRKYPPNFFCPGLLDADAS